MGVLGVTTPHEEFAETQAEISQETEQNALPPGIPQEMTELFEAALAGTLPRRRELKPWEPATLSPRHLEMVLMKASGIRNNVIAKFFAVEETNVSVVTRHPDARYLMARMLAGASNHVSDLQQRIELMGPLAAEAIEDILVSGREQNRLKAAFGILDRIPETENRREKDKAKQKIELSNEAAQLIADAMREAKQIKPNHYTEFVQDAEWSDVVADSMPGGGGGSESPTIISGGNPVGSSPPPATDSQAEQHEKVA